MLLGKRSRQPIRRTTSMTGITVDVSNNVEDVVVQEPIISDPHPPPQNHPLHEFPDANFGYDQRFLAMVSPRYPVSGRSASSSSSSTYHVVDSTTTAPFLRSCWLCNRRLAPGRDIYMYRGDTAFCSLECREQQMKQDERKEKLDIAAVAAASKKEDRHGHASSTTAATTANTSKASTKAEPMIAA